MLIGTKLPPHRTEMTYFNLGRSAFYFLVKHVVKPKKVYLPTFVCWSLASTMLKKFPDIELEFYPVHKDLSCKYPSMVKKEELLVFIHFFGHENQTPLPPCEGTLLEDTSHSYFSKIKPRGDYVFGSLRKVCKVGDGGFIQGYFNPIYEDDKKLDTWLRYEAKDWRDIREAENMIDREWVMSDISSQSLALIMSLDPDRIREQCYANQAFLADHVRVGAPLLKYQEGECPLLHNRIMDSPEERDSLRQHLAEKNIFTSIHWPILPQVKESGADVQDALWLESHILCIPVSYTYGQKEMEFIAEAIRDWKK